MPSKTYHLLKDLYAYKATIKRNFEDNDRSPEHDEVKHLLARRTQRYTIPEIELLFGFLWTAHDECVLCNNFGDFSTLQIRAAKAKIESGELSIKRLRELAAADGVTLTQPGMTGG